MKHQQTNNKRAFSESEGTGINKVILLTILLLTSTFSFANSIHLFSSVENDDVLIGLLFESDKNRLTKVEGTVEKGVFQGINTQLTHNVNLSLADSTSLKSSDDGTGESSDDGTGGQYSVSIVSFNLDCDSQNQSVITVEYSDGSSEQLTGELTLNGELLSCPE